DHRRRFEQLLAGKCVRRHRVGKACLHNMTLIQLFVSVGWEEREVLFAGHHAQQVLKGIKVQFPKRFPNDSLARNEWPTCTAHPLPIQMLRCSCLRKRANEKSSTSPSSSGM